MVKNETVKSSESKFIIDVIWRMQEKSFESSRKK
jgi:hypothetical protein